MKCPRCGSVELRKTNVSDNRLQQILRILLLPIRCYRCGHEFYRPTALTDHLRSTPSYRSNRRAA